MSVFREIMRAIRLTLVLWVLTAVIYPCLIILVGQLPFLQARANGSLVVNLEGQLIGSALIGQAFSSNRYFISRPSTVDYSIGKDAAPTGVSGASNLAPSHPQLLKRIQAQVAQLQDGGIGPTSDLVYASGSGLDPHMTIEAAQAQIQRVAKARNLSADEIVPLIKRNTEGRFLGIFGELGVNALKLNYALDVLQNPKQQQIQSKVKY